MWNWLKNIKNGYVQDKVVFVEMNIFFLSRKTRQCAKWHCDKHVVKMILESTQLLYTAHRENGGNEMIEKDAPICVTSGKRGYKGTHKNHPSAIWVRESLAHYSWLLWLAKDLVEEHMYRFSPKPYHACLVHLEWFEANPPPGLMDKTEWIRDPIPAMPNEYKRTNDSLTSYRNFYNGSKRERGLLKYTKRHMPHIFETNTCIEI